MGATPFTLRCPKCKVGREYRIEHPNYDSRSDRNLIPTGKTRVVKRTAAGVHDVQAVQMKHDCGHVFWTTHPSAVRQVFPNAKSCGNASAHNTRVREE